MRRLFIGIEPPAALKTTALSACTGYPASRWQQEEQLHLTLRFLGQIPEYQLGTLNVALKTVDAPRFELAVNGVGCFGSAQAPRILWAGVTPTGPVEALNRAIDAALPSLGLSTDGEEFRPHITLARLRASALPADAWLKQHSALASAPALISEFVLVSSVPDVDGSRYTTIGRYPLG